MLLIESIQICEELMAVLTVAQPATRLEKERSSLFPIAEALIHATSRANAATLWTQDADFEGLEQVRYWAGTR